MKDNRWVFGRPIINRWLCVRPPIDWGRARTSTYVALKFSGLLGQKKSPFLRFLLAWLEYILWNTIEMCFFCLKWWVNQLCTTNRSGDITFRLFGYFQAFLGKKGTFLRFLLAWLEYILWKTIEMCFFCLKWWVNQFCRTNRSGDIKFRLFCYFQAFLGKKGPFLRFLLAWLGYMWPVRRLRETRVYKLARCACKNNKRACSK